MPLKTGKLTPQERSFVAAYVKSGDGAYSAEQAGYASPRVGASKNLAKASVQDAIRERQLVILNEDLLPKAVAVLGDLLQAKTPANVRFQAAKYVIDRAIPVGEDGRRKEPHEMTPEEIDAALSSLKREAAERAKPILEHQPAGVFG